MRRRQYSFSAEKMEKSPVCVSSKVRLTLLQLSLCRKPIIRRFRYFGGEHMYTIMTTVDNIR